MTTLTETLVVETLRLRRLLGIRDARDAEVESRLLKEDAVGLPGSPELVVSESEGTSVLGPTSLVKESSPVTKESHPLAKQTHRKQLLSDSVNGLSPCDSPFPLCSADSPFPLCSADSLFPLCSADSPFPLCSADSPFPLCSADSPSSGDVPINSSSSLSALVDTMVLEAAEAEAVATREVETLVACFLQSVETHAPIEVTQTVSELVDGVIGTLGIAPQWQSIRKECWEEVIEATQQCEAIVQALWRLLVVGIGVLD